jgi:serine/threonine-protein kinase
VAGSVFGTPNYISPEAFHDSKAVDARSDIYSLGATLYDAATGRPPFEGQNAILVMEQVCNTDPDPPGKVNPALSEGFSRVLLQTLAKRPADRYRDAGALKADLERVLKGEAPLAKIPPSRPKRTPSGRQRKSSKRISSRSRAGGKGIFGRILGLFGLGKK